MVLKDAQAETMMQDAYAMQAAAVQRLEAGDWRDAAEKAWCATRNATQAMVLEILGEDNPRSTKIESGLRLLSHERGGQWTELRNRFGYVAHYLHGRAFYDGIYSDDLPELVRGVADYIRLAEELASG